jgi:hypothetical protein
MLDGVIMNTVEIQMFFMEVSADISAYISGGFMINRTQPNLPFFPQRENDIARVSRQLFGDNDIITRIFSSNNSSYRL